MISNKEKKRRQELVRACQERERAAERADAEKRLPFPLTHLVHLFKYVDTGWEQHGCDHTPRRAIEYLYEIGLPQDKQADVLAWLREQGRGCDCEILANVVDEWIEDFKPEHWTFFGV